MNVKPETFSSQRPEVEASSVRNGHSQGVRGAATRETRAQTTVSGWPKPRPAGVTPRESVTDTGELDRSQEAKLCCLPSRLVTHPDAKKKP